MQSQLTSPNNETSSKVAEILLDIKAVFLRPEEPFTWTSGIKSPIYCDNRLIISHPEARKFIIDAFTQTVQTNYPDAEVIAGTATAGIPHAAWIADRLNLPMVYIRSSSKAHGRENKIEGSLKSKQKVVVIEDLISTGGSSIKAAQAVQESDAEVLGTVAIFSYQLQKALNAFKEANIECHTLSNYSKLLEVALQKKLIKKEHLEALKAWRENPEEYCHS